MSPVSALVSSQLSGGFSNPVENDPDEEAMIVCIYLLFLTTLPLTITASGAVGIDDATVPEESTLTTGRVVGPVKASLSALTLVQALIRGGDISEEAIKASLTKTRSSTLEILTGGLARHTVDAVGRVQLFAFSESQTILNGRQVGPELAANDALAVVMASLGISNCSVGLD